MSGLFGYIDNNCRERTNELLSLFQTNYYRGTDSYGALLKGRHTKTISVEKNQHKTNIPQHLFQHSQFIDFMIGAFDSDNLLDAHISKDDIHVQPFFESARTYIVHDGYISNALELQTKYSLPKHTSSSQVIAQLYNLNIEATRDIEQAIIKTCNVLKGAYAFMLHDIALNKLIICKNYQSLYINYSPFKYLYVGSEISTKYNLCYTQIPAYTALVINPQNIFVENQFSIKNDVASTHIPIKKTDTCVVVCSGGIDSSVAAYISKKMLGFSNTIIANLNLGQRGWQSEKKSSLLIAKDLNAKYIHLDIKNLFSKFSKTPLTDYSLSVTTGISSASSAAEWVVIRNTILSSICAGIAETHGASVVVTGCNMEEEAAYPDNSITWIAAFSNMLQHGSLYGIKMLPVVSHLMKRDLILLGNALDVPFHCTTSCYDPISIKESSDKMRILQAKSLQLTHIPCGACGSCSLRRHAFLAARIRDPYETFYMEDIQPFGSYNFYMEQINKEGYIDITNEAWKKETIEKYKLKIMEAN